MGGEPEQISPSRFGFDPTPAVRPQPHRWAPFTQFSEMERPCPLKRPNTPILPALCRSAVPGTSSPHQQSRRRDMHTLTKILQEFVSLFVDDGTLAATILIWVAFYGLLLQLLPMGSWQGPILFIGLAVILIENARRSARSSG